MNTSDFDYDLPPESIAQQPIEPRDTARLMVLERSTGQVQHDRFYRLGDYLQPGDVLVVNQTRVIPARLFARKLPGGGRVEVLLLKQLESKTWEVLVGGKGLTPGRNIKVENGPQAEVLAVLDGPKRVVRFETPIDESLERAGHMPLPPYITAPLENPERYQTVYARQPGSAAAPTAGLHFTPRLIQALTERGIQFAYLTLHVGLDTFAPVMENDPREHIIHTEWCELDQVAAVVINQARQTGKRIVAVGTTSVRTLETAARHAVAEQAVGAFAGPTDLFILPGFSFQVVDALVTNFHLPKSTLIMLVSAFAGRETVLDAYGLAQREGYRFYSFGDAMLVL